MSTEDPQTELRNLVLQATAAAARFADDKLDLQEDVRALSETVQGLTATVRDTFVPRSELEEGYPDFDVLFSQMAAVREQVTAQTKYRLRSAIITLVLALVLVTGILWKVGQRENEDRERDRIETDLRTCERSNILREQVIGLSKANETMVRTILDTSFGTDPTPERQALRERLNGPIAVYSEIIDGIKMTDCTKVTLGAKSEVKR